MPLRPNLELAKRLREQREYLGFLQSEVALALGLSVSTVSRIEAGTRRVRVPELKRLAQLYKCSVAFLQGELAEDAPSLSTATQALLAGATLCDQDKAEVARFARFLAAGSA